MSSCLPMLIQLPIIFALYRVFREGLANESMEYLYSFVSAPESIDPMFLGIVDMATPNLILAVLAGIFQFFQSRMIFAKQKNKKQLFHPGSPDHSFTILPSGVTE